MTGSQLPPVLPRPRLEARLDGVRTRRLAVVLGGAGYGKSTLVAAWLGSRDDLDAAWVRLDAGARELHRLVGRTLRGIERAIGSLPGDLGASVGVTTTDDEADAIARAEAFAARLCEALDASLRRPLVLVFDDLHEIAETEPASRFVEALVRGAPPELHLVLTSRAPVPFPIERLRGQGEVVELAADQLSFTRAELEALLGELEPPAAELGSEVLRVTGGWPALARLVLEALRGAAPDKRAATLDRMVAPEGPLLSYIAEEVLAQEDPATVEVLRVACRFERVSAELLGALEVVVDAGRILDDLANRAFFVEAGSEDGLRTYVIHGLVRDFVQARLTVPPGEDRRLHRAAAEWLESRGRHREALTQLVQAGDRAAVAERLEARGLELVRLGWIDAVVDAARTLPEETRSPAIETILGDALLRRGEWRAAMDALRRAGGDRDVLPPGLAWRIGLIQHERGQVADAVATFGRADLAQGAPDDLALVAAWRAIAAWQLADVEACRSWATFALDVARDAGDDRAMACALAAVGALAHLDADLPRSVDSFRQAVAAAGRARDLLLQVRFSTDLGYVLVLAGRYADGLAAHDEAVRLAAGLGYSTFLALALADRGQAHVALGRLEEAGADYAAARELFEQLDSRWVSYARFRQAALHRLRGETLLARAEYESVLTDAAAIGGPWFLADAIVGLAATIVDDDPQEALRLVREATVPRETWELASPFLGAARVALSAGRRDLAAGHAARALQVATTSQDRPSLAGALELLAQVEDDPARARSLLDEADALWASLGSPIGRARHDLVRAELLGGVEGHAAAVRAAAAFRAMGARRMADAAELLAGRLELAVRPAVEIRSLGAFAVLRHGEPVGVGEWQSKKARDLLKVLITRRGRATTREALCEVLWPDEDPGPLPNRLSVALATIRSVLDPDRRFSPDHFIRADRASVSLDLRTVVVDVEQFLASAAGARRRLAAGDDVRAELAELEAAYGGDFLEEDAYEEWAAPLREEARAAYHAVARGLAGLATEAGDADTAIRLFLRILEHDPFDEEAHLGLVRALSSAGRHGEARRRYRVYTAGMEELGIEAAAYPAPIAAVAPSRRALSPA